MLNTIKDLFHFDGTVLRNIVGTHLVSNYFDDLSDDPKDWQEAKIATAGAQAFHGTWLQENVIDFVFHQRTFSKSRFSDGSLPVWYGSVELETTFYETLYHVKKHFMAHTPGLINTKSNTPIYFARGVFSTLCQSALVDLRKHTHKAPFLVDKQQYQDTQAIGLKLSKEGFPGIITHSARKKQGTNLAIFTPAVLTTPKHTDDYLYEIDPANLTQTKILEYHTKKVALTITDDTL